MTDVRSEKGSARLLVLALGALLAAVWLEAPGSRLAEPDEARYAEIPREMLAARDFVTPTLNGVPYFEKPPLLYWANAASFAIFGENPFAARLPTRLAGTATALLLAWAVGRKRGRTEGLLAAILVLAAPFGFTAARTNLTDGILTFCFTATLFASWEVLDRANDGRPTAAPAALAGALAAAGFLAKGLVAIVLPGAILVLGAFLARRPRTLRALLVSPAPFVFLALAAPWFVLAERAHPGFLNFFFVHEHFQRFATPAASRPGPIYYFAALFLAGFLPGLPFLFRGAREAGRRDPFALFLVLWAAVVIVFFSLSKSKLPPYIFPAFPPAAALAARGLAGARRKAPWIAHAALAAALIVAVAAVPDAREEIARGGIGALAVAGALSLAAGAVFGLLTKNPLRAAAALGLGWAGFYAVLDLAWPRVELSTGLPALAAEARDAAAPSGARVVSYRGYVQPLPWEMRAIVPIVDYKGEIEDWWLPQGRLREIFWTRERFWDTWRSERIVALARDRDREDFRGASPPARFLACRDNYCVVVNW
ncbi:MAG TPA: glycosyltransferase family 39 protein [Thermoanaerobaculia bacterium]